MSEYLEIPVAVKRGSVKLVVYPQSSKAKVFEEQEPYAGESRYQLVEGGTYTHRNRPCCVQLQTMSFG